MKVIATVIALVFAVAVIAAEPTSEPPVPSSTVSGKNEKQKAATGHKAANNQQRGTEDAPVVVKVLPAEKTAKAAEQEAAEREEKATNERLLVRANVALTVFTAVLTILTFGLFLWTRKMVLVAEQGAQRQLRAYVSGDPNWIYNFDATTRVKLKFDMRNHGQTPAYQLRQSALVDICPYPLPADYPFPELRPQAPSRFVLHPNTPYWGRCIASRLFTDAEIDSVVAGNRFRIYIFGRIQYVDAFQIERETRFCSSVQGGENLALVARGGQSGDIGFEPADQHNEAN